MGDCGSVEEPYHHSTNFQILSFHHCSIVGISGERIWVEVKKILVGNHASDIVRVMMELGMGPYIGEFTRSDQGPINITAWAKNAFFPSIRPSRISRCG